MKQLGCLALLFCACSASTDTMMTDGIDPLVPQIAGLPFPSNVYLVDDPKTPTGKHVQFLPKTLPAQGDVPIDPAAWLGQDGFSPGQAAIAFLPGATATGLPDENHLADSITTQSPTILLDTSSGKLVPHLAELDGTSHDDSERTLLIRPMVRLADATRYIVAIRRVVDASGKPIPPSDGFRALRDGHGFSDKSIARRRALYDDIFARLAAAGIDKSDLQLAWDYSTASRENNTRLMLAVRDAALAAVGAAGPSYTITTVDENPNPHIRRRITGKMHAPLFLDSATPNGKMVFDAAGNPMQNGFGDFEFLVQIPNSATTGTPLPILQNGHGLLGSKSEGENGYMAVICDTKGYVEIAVDLFGFASPDVPAVGNAIGVDISQFGHIVERQIQGHVNQLVAMRMMKGSFWKDPMVQFNGVSAIDPSHAYYRGDSQGGIMGTVYMSISTDVTRGLLGEPGMPYDLLLNRSTDFTGYLDLIQAVVPNWAQIQILLGSVQMLWDRSEPDGYAPYLTDNPLPGTPSHNVLLNIAIGDHQVTPLGAHIIARAVGAKNLKPVNREIFGVDDADAPFGGNGMAEWDFALPPAPMNNLPMTAGEDPHDKVRNLQSAIDMTDQFLKTGMVQNTCGGQCKGQ